MIRGLVRWRVGAWGAFASLMWLAALGSPATASARVPYHALAPVLSTPWTASVSPTLPLPDYPRPQFERSAWLNLNGQWEYEAGARAERAPTGRELAQTILVPFPVQSALSGIGRSDEYGWYRRFFVVPASWHGQRVLLNFGAVAWRASVYVNGHLLAVHQGDYDGFSVDVTHALRPHGANELVVGFWNPIGAHGEPVGKQIPVTPYSFYHSASSGIWQTVWLEPVPVSHLTGVDVHTVGARGGRVTVDATAAGSLGGLHLSVRALTATGHSILVASGPVGRPLALTIPRARRWSPSDPYLYDLSVALMRGTQVVDRAKSYFGIRTIGLAQVGGVTRIVLNGHFLFGSGALDQSMWPDGQYTAPTDAALRSDVDTAVRLGYNLLRVHMVVEPERWYMWADRVGLLVLQDMPSTALRSPLARQPAAQNEFRHELAAVVSEREAHPSIVAWVGFNEGWNAFDPLGIVAQIRRLDPTRLIDTDSGSANTGNTPEVAAGDVRDTHLYPGPFSVPPDRRASVVGEFGGILPLPGSIDRWPGVLTSVGSPVAGWPHTDIESALRAQYADLREEEIHGGVSAAVFTELFATEQETGLVSYDRRQTLLPTPFVADLNASVIGASAEASGAGTSPGSSGPSGRSAPPVAATPAGTDHLWLFDEGGGTAAADAVGGAGGELTLSGAGGWTGGVRGTALAFGGTGGAAVAGAPLVDPTHSFTVAAWLSAGEPHETGWAVSEPGGTASAFALGLETMTPSGQPPRTWWTFGVDRDGGCAGVACGAAANMHYGDGRFSPGVGRWHYVVGVYDAPARTITLFVDGLAQDVEHTSPLPAATGALTVGTGALGNAPPAPFIGRIDSLRTFPRALVPAEVWGLYAASRPNDPL